MSHTVAFLPVTPPSMIPPPCYVKAIWHMKCEDVSGLPTFYPWRLDWNPYRNISCSASAYTTQTPKKRDAVWNVNETFLVFWLYLELLHSETILKLRYRVSLHTSLLTDYAVLKMIRHTDACQLLSLCLSQPVKQCRVMNNNAGKLFHYRITVSPPTNFLVSLFFLSRPPKL